eukprot:7952826-Karenia_brevis.AAC.1
MTEERRWGTRRCVLETSRREFAIRDIMEQDNGQFQRAHLDPDSSAGKAFMHHQSGGWKLSPFEGPGWGAPTSSQLRSAQD